MLLRSAEAADAISVYVHVPYCDRLCWFCGCHTKQTLSYEPVRAYTRKLIRELDLFGERMSGRPKLSRLHLGGGSPSLLRAEELERLRQAVDRTFNVARQAEISVEIDPSDLNRDGFEPLINFGLNRASIGVQDFDPAVQRAINRPQSFELTRDVVNELRRRGVGCINIDALYGLPHQSLERLTATIGKIVSLQPDRIALFGYAHLPSMKPHQRMIPAEFLPGREERLAHSQSAARQIIAAGYVPVGIDHFARPSDSLAKASQAGTLRRNFQGYTDDACDVLLGLGTSSISQFNGGYIQNHAATGLYSASIENGHFAHDRGFALSPADQMRGWIIERLMCNFGFRREELLSRFGGDGSALWDEAAAMAHGRYSGMVDFADDAFLVQQHARPLVRYVASGFDTYLNVNEFRYSMAI
jgi:oxygen-independent coproporphyrinogen-3 oxidase